MTFAVTGANGFIGTALCAELSRRKIPFKTLARDASGDYAGAASELAGVDTVLHVAGLAHVKASAAAFDRANRALTLSLALTARKAGVRRLVYLSSIAVLGNRSGNMLSVEMPVDPQTPYGLSKAKAEAGLRAMIDLEVVILRPPLVYAPGAKGNLALLEKLSRTGLPLPFADIDNCRDMVGRANLVDALIFLASAKTVAGEVFHVCDGEPMSLACLIGLMRRNAGRKPMLFSFPESVLRAAFLVMLGPLRSGQLLGDLRVDDASLRAAGWTPPFPAGHDYLA
jgi:UDP-glucose 4-epimerase